MTGWNLQPGVTDRMIDEAAGAFDEDETPPTEEEQRADAWEYWHQRAIRFEAALDEIRRHCGDNGEAPADRGGRWAAQVASDALRG